MQTGVVKLVRIDCEFNCPYYNYKYIYNRHKGDNCLVDLASLEGCYDDNDTGNQHCWEVKHNGTLLMILEPK